MVNRYAFTRTLSSILNPLSSIFASSPHAVSSHHLTRWLFLRGLGLVYFTAFVSLWVQLSGLIGSRGILPAADFLTAVYSQLGAQSYYYLPTLFWLNTSDTFLHLVCGGGALLSLLLIVGIAPGPILLLLWAFYLSLMVGGQDFLAFQWDNLLLETGFLAIFFAPWQFWPKLIHESPPAPVWLWLLRWLLFKLMFSSGAVKLLSGDPTWRDLTALNYHYETQPLPAWTSWYAHQLPAWFQKSSVVGMFVIELIVPFLIFAPRRLRFIGCAALVALQLFIILTGNFAFFNWLTIVLCLLLLDDAFWRRWLPHRLTAQIPNAFSASAEIGRGSHGWNGFLAWFYPLDPANPRPILLVRMQQILSLALAVLIFLLSSAHLVRLVAPLPRPVQQALVWIAPFRSINSYGLFAVMTTTRPEIIIEGSNDGESWQAYEFKWKPGDPLRRPTFVAPHQPRLDWQMWFAALDTYQNNPWLINLMLRLLEGSPEVLALLDHNPFPDAPPRTIRAMLYLYRFTDFNTAQPNSAWWQREQRLQYAPVLSRASQ
ncbi:MAG: lipase maturation factor family protein [Anaerolineae bacterium]|nr:lipase maturation factor family protein [Anaerolineales bacterium]MCQ3974948.1 lipase maturation factor family protein [Anaerolineae bacterium]